MNEIILTLWIAAFVIALIIRIFAKTDETKEAAALCIVGSLFFGPLVSLYYIYMITKRSDE